jgi:hypothetical protein
MGGGSGTIWWHWVVVFREITALGGARILSRRASASAYVGYFAPMFDFHHLIALWMSLGRIVLVQRAGLTRDATK